MFSEHLQLYLFNLICVPVKIFFKSRFCKFCFLASLLLYGIGNKQKVRSWFNLVIKESDPNMVLLSPVF